VVVALSGRVREVFQVRIHGRGGQGVVTAAELLSVAAFVDGRHAQAFPSFGSERTGAPVVSFCRIASKPIRTREPVTDPDALVVQDPTLLHQVDLFSGLRSEGFVLINTSRSFEELGLSEFSRKFHEGRLLTVPATDLAIAHTGRPTPNAVMLGGFAALTGIVSLESVLVAIRDRFAGSIADANAVAAADAFEVVSKEREELVGAATA
jgi:pyruvate ferredoxin oxidoreductase gamma subunit